jgi:hypothetical protein
MTRLTATNGRVGMDIRFMNTKYHIVNLDLLSYDVSYTSNNGHKNTGFFIRDKVHTHDIEILNTKRNRPGAIT